MRWETWTGDVAWALRGWKRHPGFPLGIALTLGLGLGANVVVFSIVDAVLLRPLPYPAPDRLALVWTELPRRDEFAAHASGPELQALWDKATCFEAVGGVWARPGVLRGDDGPVEEIEVGWITPGFLEALGVHPYLGRLPTAEEQAAATPEVIVLSHGLWQTRYGGDPAVVGRTIAFDDERKTVVGVMPRGFQMLFPPGHGVPERVAAWLPWGGNAYGEMSRGFRVFSPVARLAPGVSFERAAAEVRTLASSVESEATEYSASGFGLRLETLGPSVAAHARPALLVLLAVSVLVLLVACANVASLGLARTADRTRELAVRTALGASRGRLLREMLTESALLGLLGAAAGFLLAAWGLPLLLSLEPGRLPRAHEIGLDGRALTYGAAATVLAALLFGSVTAFHGLRAAGALALRDGAREASARQGSRPALVVAQLGLSLVLLAGAGLLVRSFTAVAAVDPGFDPEGVVTLRLSLPDVQYRYADQGPKIAEFYRRLDERLAALPGVAAVGATLAPPLSGAPLRARPYAFRGEGRETEWGSTVAHYTTVTPGWFRAAGVRLSAGRFLEERDDRTHGLAVVVDAALARKAWPGAAAVGQAIRVEVFREGRFQPDWGEVVGVVESVHLNRLERVEREQVFLAHAQAPQRTMFPTLRTTGGDPMALLPAIQAAVGALEKDLPAFEVRLAADHLAAASALLRFCLAGLLAFASVAVVLATGGVYGLMACLARGRRREMGIRLALGADPRRVLALMLRQGMALVGLGTAVGLLGALGSTRVLSGLLFGVAATDALTLAAAVALLAGAGFLACLVPAVAAARVHPTEALRCE